MNGNEGMGGAGWRPTATIAVTARQGAEVLAPFLATLANQLVAPGRVDLLVLRSRRDGATADLLDDWRRRRPIPARVLCTSSLSDACNAALDSSREDVVVFTDEHCLLPPTWARAHLETYSTDRTAVAVGGPIGVHWPVGRSALVESAPSAWFDGFDLGDDVCQFPMDVGPRSGNFSVHRRAAIDAGAFANDHEAPVVGAPAAATLQLANRLRMTGGAIVYQPAAAAIVRMTPDLLGRRALVRRSWAEGLTSSAAGQESPAHVAGAGGFAIGLNVVAGLAHRVGRFGRIATARR